MGISILVSLYFFICSLSFLSDSFRLIGGKNLGAFFADSTVLNNPVVGVMIGVLVTVLVQSSSTSTTIIVGLVATDVPVKTAIPMIMGSNIGTSVTNTIVSFTQISNREEFKRAFAAATVHDMFNWLTVILLVIVEQTTGYLEIVSGYIVEAMLSSKTSGGKSPDFLKALATVLIIVAVVTLMVVTLNICQKYKAKILPEKFRTWDFLPEPLHSLEPYDRIIVRLNCFKLCRKDIDLGTGTDAYNNKGFQQDIP